MGWHCLPGAVWSIRRWQRLGGLSPARVPPPFSGSPAIDGVVKASGWPSQPAAAGIYGGMCLGEGFITAVKELSVCRAGHGSALPGAAGRGLALPGTPGWGSATGCVGCCSCLRGCAGGCWMRFLGTQPWALAVPPGPELLLLPLPRIPQFRNRSLCHQPGLLFPFKWCHSAISWPL